MIAIQSAAAAEAEIQQPRLLPVGRPLLAAAAGWLPEPAARQLPQPS